MAEKNAVMGKDLRAANLHFLQADRPRMAAVDQSAILVKKGPEIKMKALGETREIQAGEEYIARTTRATGGTPLAFEFQSSAHGSFIGHQSSTPAGKKPALHVGTPALGREGFEPSKA
ncbi:MAG: hypothetical protein NT080_13970 [Spirochaetes bacterium]|nr:hypothetical protein [Spirochaetota bacterium]